MIKTERCRANYSKVREPLQKNSNVTSRDADNDVSITEPIYHWILGVIN